MEDKYIKTLAWIITTVGTTQTTTTAMVYSQTWTNANGSGELYLTKLDKKILGVGNRIGYFNPYSDLMQEEEAND